VLLVAKQQCYYYKTGYLNEFETIRKEITDILTQGKISESQYKILNKKNFIIPRRDRRIKNAIDIII
jgi:hypothetical protein